ncbi:MAG: aldehyde-activating protein, partial [Euryarchaeota archaeon TMED255]
MSEQASGSCLCGRMSYSFDKDHVISAHHCHCTDCRKMTGSGKATIIMVPTEKLKLSGEL